MNTYVISPNDERVNKQVKAVWIVNEFKHKGFTTQKKFLEIVHLYYPGLNNYESTRKLALFWLFRNLKYVNELEQLIKQALIWKKLT